MLSLSAQNFGGGCTLYSTWSCLLRRVRRPRVYLPSKRSGSTVCIYRVRYEWDEKKNRGNQRKHEGISFELAALVFEDRNCFVVPDRIDETGEQRWHAIGQVQLEPGAAAVLLVVHTHREEHHGEEIIRIISARRAEKHEVHRYQAAAMD